MASGSRKLGPLDLFESLALELFIHPLNFGTFGRLRVISSISTSSLLKPWYRILVGRSFSERIGLLQSLSLTFFFPIRSVARSAATFISELRVSGSAMNSLNSILLSSSQRYFNHRNSETLARDPCENTCSRLSVPVSRLVNCETLNSLKGPSNLGNLILAFVIRNF